MTTRSNQTLDHDSSSSIARIATMCADIGAELDRLGGKPSSQDSTARGPDLVRGEPVDTSYAEPRRSPTASADGAASARGTVVVLPKVLRLDGGALSGAAPGGRARDAALLLAGFVLSTAGAHCARRVLARRPSR
ncbi:hypothetical protein FHX42_005097 [Saccharopolyspora lacisalsi]|uniref:Uncharacterized protein n=1 Tax=Halosaccharopolyspora lacisalsi TaxID=1000566 RepID=A0A839E0G6_9PSEU|nr:hypothetical protein [Halosaccharopolyspora lacisalsi]MBA8827692.1 hypothetical protein [Halosaccharopolyspora lacisalsi]